MAKKIINVSLNTKSINNAIKELEQYKKDLLEKAKLLTEKLADIGVSVAEVRFKSAAYDGINDVSVTPMKTGKGFAVVAEGQAVAFIEFGTGVHYNPSEPYPNPRPAGIVGIGEYGKGKGGRVREDGSAIPWVYNGDAGTNGIKLDNGAILTRGNPAAMPMWYASEEMRKSVQQIVREVFGG